MKPDWEGIGLGNPKTLKAENVVHSTGFRIEKTKNGNGKIIEKGVFFKRPEEIAEISPEGVLSFPMTPWNYRMIVISKKSGLSQNVPSGKSGARR